MCEGWLNNPTEFYLKRKCGKKAILSVWSDILIDCYGYRLIYTGFGNISTASVIWSIPMIKLEHVLHNGEFRLDFPIILLAACVVIRSYDSKSVYTYSPDWLAHY